MKFSTPQHKYYCGIDLPARSRYGGLLDQAGTILVHKKVAATHGISTKAVSRFQENVPPAAWGVMGLPAEGACQAWATAKIATSQSSGSLAATDAPASIPEAAVQIPGADTAVSFGPWPDQQPLSPRATFPVSSP